MNVAENTGFARKTEHTSSGGPLGRRAAFALPAIALLTGAATVSPDALLIRRCAAYIAAWEAQELHGGHEELEDCPYAQALAAAGDGLAATPAHTLAGIRAKALVAKVMATQPNGSLDYGDAFTGRWPAYVITDVLRLTGGIA